LLSVRSFSRVFLTIHNLTPRKHAFKYSVSGFPQLPTFSFRFGRKKRKLEPARTGLGSRGIGKSNGASDSSRPDSGDIGSIEGPDEGIREATQKARSAGSVRPGLGGAGLGAAPRGPLAPLPGIALKHKTNPRSGLESTKVLKNEPETNPNEPKLTPLRTAQVP
jgi:hypothetical protein